MPYLRVHQKSEELRPVHNKSRNALKDPPSQDSPPMKAPQGFRPLKTPRKTNLGSSGLRAFAPNPGKGMDLPYFEHSVAAGYPTATEDPFTRHLDISRYLTMSPKTTYYYKMTGCSMVNAGINHGDLLVVDTTLNPKHRDIIIAVLKGEFTLKRYYVEGTQVKLLSGNPDYPPLTVTKDMEFFVQGIVTTVIRTFNPLPYDNHFQDLSYAYLRE